MSEQPAFSKDPTFRDDPARAEGNGEEDRRIDAEQQGTEPGARGEDPLAPGASLVTDGQDAVEPNEPA
jgi:hypothetical protein